MKDPIPTTDITITGNCVETWTLIDSSVTQKVQEERRVYDAYFGIYAIYMVYYLVGKFTYKVEKQCSYVDPETGKVQTETYPPTTVIKEPAPIEVYSHPKNGILDFIQDNGVGFVIGSGGIYFGTSEVNYYNDNYKPPVDDGKVTVSGFEITLEQSTTEERPSAEINELDPGSSQSQDKVQLEPALTLEISTPESTTVKRLMTDLIGGSRWTEWDLFSESVTVDQMRYVAQQLDPFTRDQVLAALTGYAGDVTIIMLVVEPGRVNVHLEAQDQ